VPIYALVVALVLSVDGPLPPAQSYQNTAPETFRANAQATNSAAGVAAAMSFQVDAYTPDGERERLLAALQAGGSAAFVEALKKSPVAGYITGGDRKIAIRFARAEPTATGGRRILLVTEAPVYFVGGGALDAKPTAGYDIAVVQFEVDSVGLGSGSMAAAARVKPGGTAGVQLDDYAKEPIKLMTVSRTVSK
jgi:hypothetical protein